MLASELDNTLMFENDHICCMKWKDYLMIFVMWSKAFDSLSILAKTSHRKMLWKCISQNAMYWNQKIATLTIDQIDGSLCKSHIFTLPEILIL